MLVPVSPSGTGKTFSSLILLLFKLNCGAGGADHAAKAARRQKFVSKGNTSVVADDRPRLNQW